MKALITGGAGLIGYHLARYHLDRGDTVVIIDNLLKAGGVMDDPLRALVARPGVVYLPVDLTHSASELAAVTPIDVVYHLAAINGTRLFYEIPYRVARDNVLMTLHLLAAMEGRPIGQLVYASTSEVYAGAERVSLLSIPTDEDVPVVFPQPTDVRFSYGTSKFMGEFLCLRFGLEFGVPTSVVRYHNIYGPRMGDKHVIPEFIGRLRRRERPFRIYGGQETRAFCYVDDAVQATYLVATTAACHDQVIHIGNSKEEIGIEALARLMMELMGETVDILECGRRGGSVSRRCPDTTKLRRLTGFEPQVDIRQGLARTIDWYSAQPPV